MKVKTELKTGIFGKPINRMDILTPSPSEIVIPNQGSQTIASFFSSLATTFNNIIHNPKFWTFPF
jgi:hypothetical protein